jgi:excisionase family DNA binding protein
MRKPTPSLNSRHQLMTIAEVSELLGFHPVTLRGWARCGVLPAIRIAGRWRLDSRSLTAWLEAKNSSPQ